MKIIGLMPVRNEAWVLQHSLASLSGFCDVVIVSDQNSDDESIAVCRRFPKVVVLESSESRVCEAARWQLLDVARNYDGHNLLWWADADELLSPSLANAFLSAAADELRPGTAVECRFITLLGSPRQFRDDSSIYRPSRMVMGIVDDRQVDYDRSRSLPLHEARVSMKAGATVLKPEDLPVLHLQWLFGERNQIKQAWYRCREWIEQHKTAVDINRYYSVSLPPRTVRTGSVPEHWIRDLTFPDPARDLDPTWHERELLEWFDRYGIEFFEPLEIWHVDRLNREFRRRLRRQPRPDRSYRSTMGTEARRLASRTFARAARAVQRMFPSSGRT